MEVRFKDARGRECSFNPARDIVHFWPKIVAAALVGLDEDSWDEPLKNLLRPKNLREIDLLGVAVNFIRFCERALDPQMRSPWDAVEAVGLYQSPPEAVMAFFYRLGVTCAGVWFNAIKRVIPASGIEEELRHLFDAGVCFSEELKKHLENSAKRDVVEASGENKNS
jgi:hypothetical protein